ncbi:MAG: restriction endonuclease subunit S [Treponema sp.]|jgi:type I restriction enzyme M protein|nr:restriction endonuclease subunit S [Treponema sp.]
MMNNGDMNRAMTATQAEYRMQLVYEKDLIKKLHFLPKEKTIDVYYKTYTNGYTLEIDFKNGIINYGKEIKSDSKTTQNFSQPENFVILECVNRLIEKGYKPQNIILEKTWNAGHGTSGRLDICVTRDDGSEYLLIECKTYGKEFDKEFDRIKKDGGQIFTYFKFSNKADVIMLYASELRGKEIVYRNEIVKIEDDYRAGDVKDFYERWNKLTKDNGVFDDAARPYNFKSKSLTPENLKEITQEDSSFIFNQFLEILRHNVVSDKPNAFNKIFTLFLCKIFDEKNSRPNEELAFQWFYAPYRYDGIQYDSPDDHISFQKRLTDLYKKGMKEFLEKEVTDISDAAFGKKYEYLGEDVRRQLLDELTEIRLKKNNEFAIKEVFDNDSFEENAKVVREVVELLQGYKIRYAAKQQYLSDFFELLLTTGLKQESGQYFTPVPVAQFIIKSLPIDKIVQEKLKKGIQDEYLPHIIDYAAGSGHFITESMHILQQLLDGCDSSKLFGGARKFVDKAKGYPYEWAIDYVYGIEKDYRLVKVGKVGCYLHGDGLARVIHSDGLGNFKNTKEYGGLLTKTDKDFPQENKQFDILVSNPPYSVSAFKNNASKFYGKDDFELYGSLTDNSSEIECLFVERMKQLLKDGGAAGIVLPSSILGNDGIYAKTRETILQYFEIIAITELGSNTFMATGTNTVVLFLMRRNNYGSINLRKSVELFFDDFRDVTRNGIEKPIDKYVHHVWENISFNSYVSLLKKEPDDAIANHTIYREYRKNTKAKNERDFWQKLIETEKEKLIYFILTYPQKVVLVKTGEKDVEKRFLGYEFSNRRGSEGIHPIQRGKTIDECTRLFDDKRFDNPQKASTYIYKAFNKEYPNIDSSLKNNVFYADLVDMLAFDQTNFDKSISLTVKKKVKIDSRWESGRLGDICEFIGKGKRPASFAAENGEISFIVSSVSEKKCDIADFNMEAIIIGDGGSANVHYMNGCFSASDHTYILKQKSEEINLKYVYDVLQSNLSIIEAGFQGSSLKNVSKTYLFDIFIPLPPREFQQKIVSEIEVLDQKEQEAKEKTESLSNKTYAILDTIKYNTVKLGSIVSLKNGLNYNRKSLGDVINIIGVSDFQNNIIPNLDLIEQIQIEGKLPEDYILQPNDLLVVRSNGSANLVGRFLLIDKILPNTSFSGFTIRLRPDFEKVNSKYLCYYLRTNKVREKLTKNSAGSNIKSLNQTLLSSLEIPLPPLAEQQKIAAKIEILETETQNLQKQREKMKIQKEQILKKYL